MNHSDLRPPSHASDAAEAMDEVLGKLQTCWQLTHLARDMALKAARGLAGARHSRTMELADKLADAQAFAQRLEFVCLGDARADAAADELA
jgi:hypothetical protein